jgi:hypothetical protein
MLYSLLFYMYLFRTYLPSSNEILPLRTHKILSDGGPLPHRFPTPFLSFSVPSSLQQARDVDPLFYRRLRLHRLQASISHPLHLWIHISATPNNQLIFMWTHKQVDALVPVAVLTPAASEANPPPVVVAFVIHAQVLHRLSDQPRAMLRTLGNRIRIGVRVRSTRSRRPCFCLHYQPRECIYSKSQYRSIPRYRPRSCSGGCMGLRRKSPSTRDNWLTTQGIGKHLLWPILNRRREPNPAINALLGRSQQSTLLPLRAPACLPPRSAKVAKLGLAPARHVIASEVQFNHLVAAGAAGPALSLANF